MVFTLASVGAGYFPEVPASQKKQADINRDNDANWQQAETRLAALEAGGGGAGASAVTFLDGSAVSFLP